MFDVRSECQSHTFKAYVLCRLRSVLPGATPADFWWSAFYAQTLYQVSL